MLGLILCIGAIYSQCADHDFIFFDDGSYIYDNPMVNRGLTADGASWALTAAHSANWHPVTWWAHMLDSELFGLNPGGHILANAALHALAAVLLLLLVERLTGSLGVAAFVAFAFAVHPANVENIAWASEKKSALSAVFGFLALYAYLHYMAQGRRRSYWSALGWYLLSLAAKPMLVTMPVLLILLDWWPLRRVQPEPSAQNQPGLESARDPRLLRGLLVEKIPFMALAAGSCVVTSLVQHQAGAMGDLSHANWAIRFANAISSYWRYFDKLLLPRDHAILYPFLSHYPPLLVALGIAGLASVSWAAFRYAARFPWLAFGWTWYVVTLLPVIGIVQVGSQSMADRYLYIPMIGLLLGGAMTARQLGAGNQLRRFSPLLATGWIAALALAAWVQTSFWTNSETLFRESIAHTTGNFLQHGALGLYFHKFGRFAEAETEFRVGLTIRPNNSGLHTNLAVTLERMGRLGEATEQAEAATRLAPGNPNYHYNLAVLYLRTNRLADGIRECEEAIRLDPHAEAARQLLTNALSLQNAAPANPNP
jgi:tetratricopeptide (TPR) repeat protein